MVTVSNVRSGAEDARTREWVSVLIVSRPLLAVPLACAPTKQSRPINQCQQTSPKDNSKGRQVGSKVFGTTSLCI